jgi:RNA polymerase sigma-70 factor (ECF subfamily)
MNPTDRNFSQSDEAERSADPDFLLSEEDEPTGEKDVPVDRHAFDDVSSPQIRNPSRSRPDSALAFHGRMSEAMSEALFEQIAVERSDIAFKEFYDYLAPKAYSVIFRILRSEDDSLDILQEVFSSFWNSAPELYKVHSNISAWILLLARNRAVDETRSSRYQKQRHTESYDVLEHDYLVTDTHTPDEKLTADAGRLEIQKAFEVLSEEHRKIMELVYFAGMTMKAVADTMQISPGTVRKTVHDSVKKLRQALKLNEATPLQLGAPSKKMAKKGIVAKRQTRIEAKPVKEIKKVAEVTESKKVEVKKVVEIKKTAEIKKVPKEKIVKAEASIKKPTRADGQSRRARHLHSLLDDLMKNREAVLETLLLPENPANTTLDQR